MSKLFDIGLNPDQSITDQRYIRTTNIVALMGMVFMLLWGVIAFFNIDSPLPAIYNGIGSILFCWALYFNRIGKQVFASIWLISVA
jgi:hypothetical protein